MPNTYVALDTRTLAVATSTVTFTSIPATYTDLILVINAGTNVGYAVRLNGDSGSNYSFTRLYGNGSSAVSDRGTNTTDITSGWGGGTNNLFTVQIMNYSNTTTFKTALTRIGDNTFTVAIAGLWRNTAAVNQVSITGTANYAIGSTFSLYGIANADQGAAKATGGMITEDSEYYYHTFGASGTFTPKQALTCDYLIVAGGGGGGGDMAGGGGAGGLRSTVTSTGGLGTLESQLSLTATTYNVIVGAGAAAQPTDASNGFSGNASSIIGGAVSITSTGGGFGGYFEANGGAGGSGGGAGRTQGGGAGGVRTASPVQGFNGGGGSGSSSTFASAGGGGGAGAVGVTGSTSSAGAGGAGLSLSAFATATLTGVSGFYAGGGAGGAFDASPALGGAGGGGFGGKIGVLANAGGNGTVSTGSGGGGGGPAGGNGGAGGSGIVIVRYTK